MKEFIDQHCDVYGVEPICKVQPIAPSTYYLHAAGRSTRRKGRPEPSVMSACAGKSNRSGTRICRPTARRKVGRQLLGCWKVSCSARTDFVLDALEQALCARQPFGRSGLIHHHSDRGVQYVSIRYTEHLAEAGIKPSVGSVGDSYDNALAEPINGLLRPR